MNTPMVSIVIPMYNAEKYIEETIKSVLVQTYQNIEIVIVDDGSTDHSYTIASNYEGMRNLRIIRQPNTGNSAARNTGLRAVKGEWIQFLDADDLLSSDKIEAQMELVDKYGSDCIYLSDYGRFWNNPQCDAQLMPLQATEDYCLGIEMLIKLWSQVADTIITTWLINKKHIDVAGNFNTAFTILEDAEFLCRILKQNMPIKFTPRGASYYRQNVAGSVTKSISLPKLKTHLQVYKTIASYFTHMYDKNDIRQGLAYMFLHRFFWAYGINRYVGLQYIDEALKLEKNGSIEEQRFYGKKMEMVKQLVGLKACLVLEYYYRRFNRKKKHHAF